MNCSRLLSSKLFLLCILAMIQLQLLAQSPREKINKLLSQKSSGLVESESEWNIDLTKQYLRLPNQMDSVKYYAKEALRLAVKENNTEIQHIAHYQMGTAYWMGDENFEAALESFLASKEIIVKTESNEYLPKVNNAIGIIYLQTGDLDEALSFHQLTYDGAKEIDDYELMAMAGANMAIIHFRTGDTLSCIKVNEDALEVLDPIKDKELDLTKVMILINLGDAYKKTKQYDKALDVVKKAKIIVEELGSFRQLGRLAILEARLLEQMGKKKELYAHVNKVLPSLPKSSGYDREIYTSLLVYQGKEFIELKNFQEAKKITTDIESYLGLSNPAHEKNLLQSLYTLNQGLGDYETAFNYLKQFMNVKDSIVSRDLQSELIDSKNKYELEKKENEIKQEQLKNLQLKSRNANLFLLLAGLGILGLGFYIFNYRKRQKQKEEMQEIEQKILALQMNPHFIFNAISSIQYYLYEEGDRKKAISHLSTFAALMRQMLENSRERFITLQEEIDFLTNYLDLQKLRFDDAFNYRILVDEDINTFDLAIPPLLTQPFVENAIEHGKIYSVENGEIILKISKENDRLSINIIDNGVGMNAVNKKQQSEIAKDSLSIKITNERLNLLSKLMKKSWNMKIVSDSKQVGTNIHINMPAISIT